MTEQHYRDKLAHHRAREIDPYVRRVWNSEPSPPHLTSITGVLRFEYDDHVDLEADVLFTAQPKAPRDPRWLRWLGSICRWGTAVGMVALLPWETDPLVRGLFGVLIGLWCWINGAAHGYEHRRKP
jgi:hypothetical protein